MDSVPWLSATDSTSFRPLGRDSRTGIEPSRHARNRELYAAALEPQAAEGLRSYADMIPDGDDLQAVEEYGFFHSTVKRQSQLTVLAFKAGVAVSEDLRLGGFDTHDNHDVWMGWLLGNLTGAVD